MFQIDAITGTISNSLGGPFPAPIDVANPFLGNGNFGVFTYESGGPASGRVQFTTGGGATLFDIVFNVPINGTDPLQYDSAISSAFPGGGNIIFSASPQAATVPGSVVGAGIPGLVIAFGGFLAWRRRRQQASSFPV